MQTAQQVLDASFLDTRCMLLEVAASLDRYDRAIEPSSDATDENDPRLRKLWQSLEILADRKSCSDRAERLLRLFSETSDQK